MDTQFENKVSLIKSTIRRLAKSQRIPLKRFSAEELDNYARRVAENDEWNIEEAAWIVLSIVRCNNDIQKQVIIECNIAEMLINKILALLEQAKPCNSTKKPKIRKTIADLGESLIFGKCAINDARYSVERGDYDSAQRRLEDVWFYCGASSLEKHEKCCMGKIVYLLNQLDSHIADSIKKCKELKGKNQ